MDKLRVQTKKPVCLNCQKKRHKAYQKIYTAKRKEIALHKLKDQV